MQATTLNFLFATALVLPLQHSLDFQERALPVHFTDVGLTIDAKWHVKIVDCEKQEDAKVSYLEDEYTSGNDFYEAPVLVVTAKHYYTTLSIREGCMNDLTDEVRRRIRMLSDALDRSAVEAYHEALRYLAEHGNYIIVGADIGSYFGYVLYLNPDADVALQKRLRGPAADALVRRLADGTPFEGFISELNAEFPGLVVRYTEIKGGDWRNKVLREVSTEHVVPDSLTRKLRAMHLVLTPEAFPDLDPSKLERLAKLLKVADVHHCEQTFQRLREEHGSRTTDIQSRWEQCDADQKCS